MADTILNEVIFRLAEQKGRWPEVSRGSGVPVSTIRKVAQGRTKNPGIDTVDKLRRFLCRDDLLPPATPSGGSARSD